MPYRIGTVMLFIWFAAGLLRMGCAQQMSMGSIAGYDGKIVSIQGRISETPNVTPGSAGEWNVRYTVELDWILSEENSRVVCPIKGGVYLTTRLQKPATQGVAGDTIAAVGKVNLFHAYHNPGQPNWPEILEGRGIEARISTKSETIKITGTETHFSRLERWRVQVRSALLTAMRIRMPR